MKKRLLSMLMAMCLMLSLVPAAFAADNSVTTKEQLKNALNGNESIITLGANIDMGNEALSITRGVTIDGGANKYAINYTGNTWAVNVTTGDAVTFKNMTLNATTDNARGIWLDVSAPQLTLDNVILSVNVHGIGMSGAPGSSQAAQITVKNHSVIQNSRIPSGKSYDTWAMCGQGDYRGISLWDVKGGTIEVEDSTIQGFGYTFNLAGTVENGIRDFADTEINVTNSTLKGWTAFNVWSANTIFNITNSYLKGINTSNGPTDGFATIVVNDNIYGYQGEEWARAQKNEFNIKGGTITTYRSGTAPEDLFRVDSDGVTRVDFLYDDVNDDFVKFIDGTGTFKTVFYSGWNLDANHWQNFMTDSVYGEENCTRISYPGTTLTWTPYGDFN